MCPHKAHVPHLWAGLHGVVQRVRARSCKRGPWAGPLTALCLSFLSVRWGLSWGTRHRTIRINICKALKAAPVPGALGCCAGEAADVMGGAQAPPPEPHPSCSGHRSSGSCPGLLGLFWRPREEPGPASPQISPRWPRLPVPSAARCASRPTGSSPS